MKSESMTDRIFVILELLSDIIHASKMADKIGLLDAVTSLERLFCEWRRELER